ncbi:MAG: polymer-forming cytoskeletal protein [bacterium]
MMRKKEGVGVSNIVGEINAFLGEGTEFKGILAFEGTVRIDGKLEGEIVTTDTLIVGEQAILNAEINVGIIVISGKITGNITAKQKIEINKTGQVFGNVKTPSLVIEEGVVFQGSCEMPSKGEVMVEKEGGKVSRIDQRKDRDKEAIASTK